MVNEFLQIEYDASNKIWSSVNYPYKDQVYGSMGERFLKTMRSIHQNKVLDYYYDTDRQKTAKEIYHESINVAKNLQRLGIKKDDVVVFYCMNNEHVSALTMGCILIGALVNYFEVHMIGEHDDYVLGILNPTVIFYEERYKKKLFESLERSTIKSLKYKFSIDGQQPPNAENDLLKLSEGIDYEAFESVEVKDPQKELAILCLTSGSTGVPKVVELTHTLVIHGMLIWWNNKSNYAPINQQDTVVFSFSPLRWVSQCIMIVESMLMGITRASCSGSVNGKYGLSTFLKTKPTHIFGAPSIILDILSELNKDDTESLKFIKYVQLAGEPSSDDLLKMSRKLMINARIFQCYGMTEMSSCITNDEDINGGKLLPGYQMQILDDQCKPLGPNQKGQISLKPPYPLKGYRGIDNAPYYNDKGLFINGDYGYIDDKDNLHVLARYKDLIYSNNLTLIPNPLERIVINLHEIKVARLAGYRKNPNDPNESGAFFVVLNPGVTSAHEEITNKLFNTLKSHLTPDELAIIQNVYYVDSVPLTTCGKVDRVALKHWALKRLESK